MTLNTVIELITLVSFIIYFILTEKRISDIEKSIHEFKILVTVLITDYAKRHKKKVTEVKLDDIFE